MRPPLNFAKPTCISLTAAFDVHTRVHFDHFIKVFLIFFIWSNLTESTSFNLTEQKKEKKVDSACRLLLSVSQATHDSLVIQPSVKAKPKF